MWKNYNLQKKNDKHVCQDKQMSSGELFVELKIKFCNKILDLYKDYCIRT